MIYLDFSKIPKQSFHNGITDLVSSPQSIGDLVHKIALKYSIIEDKKDNKYVGIQNSKKEKSPSNKKSYKLDTENKLILDIIGNRTINPTDSISASFLAGKNPKIYILFYFWIYNHIKKKVGNIPPLYVWLDDFISKAKYGRSEEEQNIVNQKYFKLFKKNGCLFTYSSGYFSNKWIIPDKFLNYFNNFYIEDLYKLIPFHRRDVNLITLFDIVHLVWNSYIMSLIPSKFHITAINTKRQIQVIRSFAHINKAFVFIPQVPIDKGYVEARNTSCKTKKGIEHLPETTKEFLIEKYFLCHEKASMSNLDKEIIDILNL